MLKKTTTTFSSQWITVAVILSICTGTLWYLNNNEQLIHRATSYFNSLSTENLIFSISIAIITFTIEIPILGWKNSSVYKLLNPDISALTDLLFWIVYTLQLGFIILFIFSLGTVSLVKDFLHPIFDYELLSYIPNPLLQLIFYMLVYDFILYWYHRICHEIQFLWDIHKYHHAATDFLLITGIRVHPVEKTIHYFITIVPLAILGAPLETFVAIHVIRMFIDRMQHSMVDWNYGWVGDWLIYSPVGHRIHHSMEREHWDKNYGDIFVFWDRIFGTYYKGNTINTEIGVTDNHYNKHIISDLINPMLLSWQSFKEGVGKSVWKSKHLRAGYSEEKPADNQ